MTLYRKKPVVIEAVQLSEENAAELQEFMGSAGKAFSNPAYARIDTLEGVMHASLGDYIIKGVQGECYPCKPEIFEATYEVVT